MKKLCLSIIIIMLLLCVSGCRKDEKQEDTEITTMESTTEAVADEILVSGNGEDTENSTIEEITAEENNGYLAPLNNGNDFDPAFEHVDIYQQEFDRNKMGSDILDFMYKYDIKGECKTVIFEEYNAERYQYIVTLAMEDGTEVKAEYYVYANDQHMYLYDEDQDLGYHEGQ